MDERLGRNKRSAAGFYHLTFNECRPREAIERLAGAEYIQLDPGVVESNAAFIDYFDRMAPAVQST